MDMNKAMRRYPRVYALLKRCGHSPLKAYSIMLDAKRGQKFALDWVRSLRHEAKPCR